MSRAVLWRMRIWLVVVMLGACASEEPVPDRGSSTEYDIAIDADTGAAQGDRLAAEAKVELVAPAADAKLAAIVQAIDRAEIEMARQAVQLTPSPTADDFAQRTLAAYTTNDEQLVIAPTTNPIADALALDGRFAVASDDDVATTYLHAEVRFLVEAEVVLAATEDMASDPALVALVRATEAMLAADRIAAANLLRAS